MKKEKKRKNILLALAFAKQIFKSSFQNKEKNQI